MRKPKQIIRTQENFEWIDEQHHHSIFINVLDFGAKGDGRTDDTQAFEKALNRCSELGSIFSNTVAKTIPCFVIPCGTYRITRTIYIKNMWLHIDFSQAILIKDFSSGFLFDVTCYKNRFHGGVFGGDNIFYLHNDNLDQGHSIMEQMELKGCKIGFQIAMQSSKVTIQHNTFDNVLHPLIQEKSDGLTFSSNWCSCPVPSDYDSNICLQGGSSIIENNLFVPLDGTLNGIETAWIENKQRNLICSKNRFGGENGGRTVINHKQKYTNSVDTYVSCCENMIDNHKDEKSAIRLYHIPNSLIMQHNYYGALMLQAISISPTKPEDFNTDLQEITTLYFSCILNENPFGYPKFRRFQFCIDNNFYHTRDNINDKYREIERENEWYFLINNYNKVDRLNNIPLRFGYDYQAQKIENKGTSSEAIYLLPVAVLSGVRLTIHFNDNTNGSNYHIVKCYRLYKTKYYDGEVREKLVIQDENKETYEDSYNSKVSIGYHNGLTGIFDDTLPTGEWFVAVKITGYSVGDVKIIVTQL